MKDKLVKEIYNNFFRKAFTSSIIAFLSLLAINILVGFFDFQWLYDKNSTLYNNLSAISRLIASPLFWVVLIIVIILLESYKSMKKMATYISSISDTADKLFSSEEDVILPDELAPLERKLNHLKSEYLKNEKIARENEQKKDELIVYLAHDIKTPLTSMIGYLSLLDEIDDMNQKRREKYIKIALEKSYRLEELINELFDVARFNSEKIILEKEKLDLNLMIEQIIDDFYPTLKEMNKKIEYTHSDNLTIEADSDKLSRVFNNLLKNATNYSSDGTDITVKSFKKNNEVIVEVTNKGKQIPKEKLDRIFEKFYRLDYARTSKTGGSGLGLAIAKEIVELHNGTIKAVSNKEETKFIVTLPIE